jgi:hypothetical protein
MNTSRFWNQMKSMPAPEAQTAKTRSFLPHCLTLR